MMLTPKNWHTFQHYNKRNPPWIKLHRALLDDYEFSQLPVESRALAPMLWLIASESKDGCIQMTTEALAFRLRVASITLEQALKPLLDKGFFSDASTMLAPCKQHATPETETEREAEVEKSPHPGSEMYVGTRTQGPATGAAFALMDGSKHSRSADLDEFPFGREA